MDTHDNRDIEVLRSYPESADDLRRLHESLATAAQREGILDIAYRTLDTPIGPLLLAATESGLVRVAFALENYEAVLQTIADRISPRILNAPRRLDSVAREIEEYFAGERQRFDLPLDWRLSAGFRRTVLNQLPRIDYGHTASYGAIAQIVGNPRAARAVGTACATNPLPIVVPCHRVVRADGTIGGYLGGVDIKHALLELEATS